jgi:hemicentin
MSHERADDVHFYLKDGGRTLKITEAFPSDSGRYSCVASSIAGNSTAAFAVNVLTRPHFDDEFSKTDFRVNEGENITLNCNVMGNPNPKVNSHSFTVF